LLIKKLFICLFLISFLHFNVNSVEVGEISARAAVVIDAETNSVIYEKNMSEQLSMASTTKIMTAILAIESGKLNCIVTATKDVNVEGTSIGIKKGDSFTLETLVWATLLESGNDAAVLIAEYLAGNETDFSVMMNRKAFELRMNSTNFVTASGLDADEHYTTAYDMALLASYAIKNPIFRKICSSESYVAEYLSPSIKETYSNHNKLLKMYEGVFGVKTGFTKKSGRCLVSACERNGITLVAVTLKAPDDWNDHIRLYDYCFEKSTAVIIDVEIPRRMKIYGSDSDFISLSFDEITVNNLYSEDVTYDVLLPEFLYAPISKRDDVGKIILYSDGVKFKEVPITAQSSAYSYEGRIEPLYTFKDKVVIFFRSIMKG